MLVKCSWILPTYVKQVEYEKAREINFTSARKMKNDLDAYNQMVSGFIASVQGHIIANKFLVLAKVRHSQPMNDSLI